MANDYLLHRILQLGQAPSFDIDRRSLLHAYVACFNFNDLCAAIRSTLHESTDVRLALRGHMLRLLREIRTPEELSALVSLIDEMLVAAEAEKPLQTIVDAFCSAVFGHLPVPTQHEILERWLDRGTRGAMARWLKATRDHPELFNSDVALIYWRRSNDYRAAKSLAYQASKTHLAEILPEIAESCEEGWIIARAATRASSISDAVWQTIQDRNPATYLYLCLKLGRIISDEDAVELVSSCPTRSDERGLAIWALGQMGMVSVLDRIREASTSR